LSNGEKVLEMIIAQVLKVSTDLVKVVYIVSQVPWNHPSLGEFESLIATKSSCLKIHNSKDDHDLFISNANTHEGLNKNLFFSINFSFSLFRIQRSFELHSTTYQ